MEEAMTAEQAVEAAKGLTFEKVWAALMENRQQIRESQHETQKRMDESLRETRKLMQESNQETQKKMDESWQRMQESNRELKNRMDESQRRIEKNLGGLGNSLEWVTEAMFTNELWKKFSDIGIPVTGQSSHRKFCDDKRVLAEADLFIENGQYAIAVEIKTKLSVEYVDEHLDRIETVRRYLDGRGDKRKLVGAVAGGVVPENVLKYAQKKGLYVVLQTGDSVAIADAPEGFKAREW